MAIIISLLIVTILTAALPFINGLLDDIVDIALHAERYMDNLTGSNWFSEVYGIFFSFGISLVVLRFLFKNKKTATSLKQRVIKYCNTNRFI